MKPKALLILLCVFTLPLLSQPYHLLVEIQPIYELDDSYWAHDYVSATNLELRDEVVSIEVSDTLLILTNERSDPWTGHEVIFEISPDLEIEFVSYHHWTDNLVMGAHSEFTVESAILSINQNPFETEWLEGRYTLAIREDWVLTERMKDEGFEETTSYYTFRGKFKVYGDQEKRMTHEEILVEQDYLYGDCDSAGVYYSPHKPAWYKQGLNTINSLIREGLSDYEFEEGRQVVGTVIIDECGKVVHDTFELTEDFDNVNVLEVLSNTYEFHEGWEPAIHHGKRVKSRVELAVY